MLRLRHTSRSCTVPRTVLLPSTTRSTTVISTIAKLAPRQRRRQILVSIVPVDLLGELSKHCGFAPQALEGPCQLRGGGLVAGDQERHELVTKLLSSHLGTILVTRVEQHRENVIAADVMLAAP